MGALSHKWISMVVGAVAVSVACAIVAMFVARADLLEASGWVQHTSDVQLSISACRIHVREAQLDVPDRSLVLAEARATAEHLLDLTADNPRQNARVKTLLSPLRTFSGDAADAVPIDQTLRELAAAEGSLMDIRIARLKRTTRWGWLVISVSACLTVLFLGVLLSALYRQSLALARTQVNLRREGALLESVFDSMADGIMAVTPERTFLHVNRAARTLLGQSFPAASFPKDWRSHIECVYEDGTAMKPEDGALARAIAGNTTDNLVYRTRPADKPDVAGTWISASGRPVRDVDGTVIAAVVSLRDVSEQKRQNDLLHAMSISDEMTGLYNRRGFLMLAEQHARVAQRQGLPFAIVFADLNGLKTINDTLGHEIGDQSIRLVADVLRETFRESDIIARLGGDEFVALLVNTDSTKQDTIAMRLQQGLVGSNAHKSSARRLSVSVGISFFDPERPLPVAELMIEADRLMYAQKRQHRRSHGISSMPSA